MLLELTLLLSLSGVLNTVCPKSVVFDLPSKSRPTQIYHTACSLQTHFDNKVGDQVNKLHGAWFRWQYPQAYYDIQQQWEEAAAEALNVSFVEVVANYVEVASPTVEVPSKVPAVGNRTVPLAPCHVIVVRPFRPFVGFGAVLLCLLATEVLVLRRSTVKRHSRKSREIRTCVTRCSRTWTRCPRSTDDKAISYQRRTAKVISALPTLYERHESRIRKTPSLQLAHSVKVQVDCVLPAPSIHEPAPTVPQPALLSNDDTVHAARQPLRTRTKTETPGTPFVASPSLARHVRVSTAPTPAYRATPESARSLDSTLDLPAVSEAPLLVLFPSLIPSQSASTSCLSPNSERRPSSMSGEILYAAAPVPPRTLSGLSYESSATRALPTSDLIYQTTHSATSGRPPYPAAPVPPAIPSALIYETSAPTLPNTNIIYETARLPPAPRPTALSSLDHAQYRTSRPAQHVSDSRSGLGHAYIATNRSIFMATRFVVLGLGSVSILVLVWLSIVSSLSYFGHPAIKTREHPSSHTTARATLQQIRVLVPMIANGIESPFPLRSVSNSSNTRKSSSSPANNSSISSRS
ncbi:hypothetical protein DFH06DRAFT_1487889 [Mycena polygramma]|nr:hypothetical protein DFH06DRAFT_1487889 [Mycena polygramma]